MVDITISNKQMKPAVVHTDQFENGVHVLRLTLSDYMQNNVDLRKYNAYVVTSLNGVMDVTQLQYSISSRKLTMTWSLSSHTLKDPGIIQYQIKFASSATDATDNNASVWMSYKGVIINRLSINAEDYMSANYPTLMKQWLDLMHTLSGSFGAEVLFMPKGEPTPLEERLDGRAYYQWLDIPNTRATCAVGTVTLGSRPYADSGLYINNVHVYVDDTSDPAYVVEPSLWIDAINNANCGVIATDLSTTDEIIIKLSAKNAGEAGNDIPIALDVATYGAAAGVTNPSGGRVSGSTLAGGSDAKVATVTPDGRFEDAHGNSLTMTREEFRDIISRAAFATMPDWSKATSITEFPYTATQKGWLVAQTSANWWGAYIKINDVKVADALGEPGDWVDSSTVHTMINIGDVVSTNHGLNFAYFVPFVGF